MAITSKRLNNSSPFFYFAVTIVFLLWMPSLRAATLPVDEASPMFGTGGHGHTYPGATLPFGFVQLSPDTRTSGWDACSGYYYPDSTILGFSHTHLSGTGGADLGELLVMPFIGKLDDSTHYEPLSADRFKSTFSHDHELAEPGYYRVMLDQYGILAELTATIHCGMHRYTFPASIQSHLLIDLTHNIGDRPTAGASLKVESSTIISGSRIDNGWTKKTTYFVIECSRPFKGAGLEVEGKPLPPGQAEAEGKNVRAHLDFNTDRGERIILRVGLSPTSVDDAKKNLEMELPDWDFDATRALAKKVWNEHLSRIQIDCSNPDTRQTFYSAMYHTMMAPTVYNNADGSYYGADQKEHLAPGFQCYSTFSLWDTFRAEMPLLTITEPERVNDFVQSLLAEYQESPSHSLPLWPLANHDTSAMFGYHAVSVIYDAYQKGFRGFDAERAYEAMTNTALNNLNRHDEYRKYGYVPWEKGKGKKFEAATARTLEFAYDDWCIAQMAAALGKTNDAAFFTKRSQNYKNVWDSKTQFFRSPKPDGTFLEPFDPTEVAHANDVATGYYTEANAWQYMFFVPQDVPGMIQLYGGNSAFIAKLDRFFDQDSDMSNWRVDVSGIIGQYAHGNEPDQQVPYLYALAGAQYKTAWRVRQVQLMCYDNTPEGLCGNDDCGQISAWYVWSAIGLYPANPANGIYVLGSPLVEKAVIRLDPKFYPAARGAPFTIIANDCSKQYCYIQSAKLNGQPLNRAWITQDEIAHGGTLELEMGILPNKNWETAN
jgi:predicted alpha-1,2-mannosidase